MSEGDGATYDGKFSLIQMLTALCWSGIASGDKSLAKYVGFAVFAPFLGEKSFMKNKLATTFLNRLKYEWTTSTTTQNVIRGILHDVIEISY